MSDTTAALEQRIRELEAENTALRAAGGEGTPPPPAREAKRGGWWRALVSAICITLASILVPVSIVGSWARVQLVSEDAFVATFAPLAHDPDVQNLVIEKATGAIDDSVDIDGITNDLFDGLAGLGLPPRAESALQLLRQPAIAGVHSLVNTAVTRIVQSDAFAEIWRKALVASHRALVASATGDQSGAITVNGQGVVGIQLGPVIDELKSALEQQGFGFASAIPTINATIVVAQSDALLVVNTVYNLAVTIGYWLPVLALVLFAAGILAARRRSVALLGTGIGFTVGAGVLAIALSAASVVLGLNAPSLGIPSQTLDTIYFAVVDAMRDTSVVLVFLGLIIAIAAWLGGRWRPAARVRRFSASLTATARHGLQRRGLSTGRFGEGLYRWRLAVRIAIIVVTVAVVFVFFRPLTFATVITALVIALVVWLIVELLSRHPDDPHAAHA